MIKGLGDYTSIAEGFELVAGQSSKVGSESLNE